MSATTNSLVARAKRFAVPLGAVATLLLGVVFVFDHNVAHAAGGAGIVAAAPLADNSGSSLLLLENAVEAVAARVTPAVVNVSVTSHAPAGETDEGGQGSGIPEGALPPGFQFFFGPHGPGTGRGQGQGHGMNGPGQIERGIGSGIIVSPDGYIVTNAH